MSRVRWVSRGNIASGFALGDQLQDLTFTKREGIRFVVGLCFVGGQDRSGNIRAVVHLSGRDLMNGVDEVAGSLGFENICGDTCFERVGDVHVLGMLAEKDDLHLRKKLVDLTSDIEPVLRGHADIHDNDVRRQGTDFLHGFETVRGFADDGETFLGKK